MVERIISFTPEVTEVPLRREHCYLSNCTTEKAYRVLWYYSNPGWVYDTIRWALTILSGQFWFIWPDWTYFYWKKLYVACKPNAHSFFYHKYIQLTLTKFNLLYYDSNCFQLTLLQCYAQVTLKLRLISSFSGRKIVTSTQRCKMSTNWLYFY